MFPCSSINLALRIASDLTAALIATHFNLVTLHITIILQAHTISCFFSPGQLSDPSTAILAAARLDPHHPHTYRLANSKLLSRHAFGAIFQAYWGATVSRYAHHILPNPFIKSPRRVGYHNASEWVEFAWHTPYVQGTAHGLVQLQKSSPSRTSPQI